jgi:hypothetical protein
MARKTLKDLQKLFTEYAAIDHSPMRVVLKGSGNGNGLYWVLFQYQNHKGRWINDEGIALSGYVDQFGVIHRGNLDKAYKRLQEMIETEKKQS